MKLKIILHKAEEGGYWAEVPALKGCYSQGETIEQAKANIREAIEGYLEAIHEDAVITNPEDEIFEFQA